MTSEEIAASEAAKAAQTAEIEKMVQAKVDEATTGLKAKNQELLGKLHQATEAAKAYAGLGDPTQLQALLNQLEGDEEGKLLKEGKLQEVVQRRVAKRDQEWQKKVEAAEAIAQGEKASKQKFLGRVLDEQIRSAIGGKVHNFAVDDAIYRARTMFTTDEDGNAIQLKDGSVVIGKDGKTPFGPGEWIEAMREQAPHWFPATASGTGASQSHGVSGANLMALPPEQRMEAARNLKR